ncbi:MAG: hypothetical protein ACRDO4_02010, partial [Nocardioides sp.]
MELKAAKELLHIQSWLTRVDEIVRRGKVAYLADDLLQEAGDSLVMSSVKQPTGCPGSTSWRLTASSGHSPSRTATSSSTSM